MTAGRRDNGSGEVMTLNLTIEVGRLRGSRLVDDYVANAPGPAPFFPGSPWDPEAYRRKAAEVDARFDTARRRAMAAAVHPTSAAAAEQLERVVERNGLFVTTGQQAGLFGGPLYTVYKALTAVALARVLERELGRPVAPLFWIASEDHDWAEVNHVRVLDPANTLHTITVEGPESGVPASMQRRLLGPGVEAAVERLAQLLPQTEFSDGVLERVRTAYTPDRTVAAAFRELITWLFQPFDLLVVEAGHPTIKDLGRDILARELTHWREHETLVRAQTERLIAAGYHAQVAVLPESANLFLELETGRERLVREGDGWALKHSGRRFTDEELRALLDAEPGRFSPNVLLRPVVESAVFPTIAYVAGPGELSYYAQIGCLFRAHGIEMPIVYPRASITLVEAKVRKVLDRFGLGLEDFRRPPHELAAELLREELPDAVVVALRRLRTDLGEGYGALLEAARAIDPTLKGPIQSARNSAFVQLEEIEKKIVQHLKRRNAIGVEQLEKAAVNLFPLGQPQERVLNVVPYLARYGAALLEAIADAIRIELDAPAPAWNGLSCG